MSDDEIVITLIYAMCLFIIAFSAGFVSGHIAGENKKKW